MLIALDRKAFEHALTRWAEALLSRPIAAAASLPEAYALDGKSARGSFDGLQKAVHLLSLLAHESGLTLAQAAVPNGGEDKTNEHKAALRLLEGLVLQGRLVTGDAIFCQRNFCRQVIDAEGDYLVFVKDNQPTLLNDIRMAFAPPAEGAFSPSAATNLDHAMDTATTLDKGHGRIERRTLKATTALNDYLDWPGVGQVGQVRARWSRTARPRTRSATSSPVFRGRWPARDSYSNGPGGIGRSRIVLTTYATSQWARTRAGSASVPVLK